MNSTSLPQGVAPDDASAWDRVKEALRRDWDQTKHDLGAKFGQNLHQDIAHTVAQASGNEPIPPRHTANEPEAWSDETAVRFGYAARLSPNYRGQDVWNTALEADLQSSWESMRSGRDWSDVRLAVRYGWTRAHRHVAA